MVQDSWFKVQDPETAIRVSRFRVQAQESTVSMDGDQCVQGKKWRVLSSDSVFESPGSEILVTVFRDQGLGFKINFHAHLLFLPRKKKIEW